MLFSPAQPFDFSLSVHQKQQRHLLAAQSIILGSQEHSGIPPDTQEASQSACVSERASTRVLEMCSQEEPKQEKEAEQHHFHTE